MVSKSFWDGFFNIFGITRRRVASFEAPVKKLGDRLGFIDMFWKGMLLVLIRQLSNAYLQNI